MPAMTETMLTTLEDRLYWTVDDTTTITGDVATVPVGFTELDESANWQIEGTGATADGQTRADRGHAHPVVINKSHTVTFSLKPKAATDPVAVRGLDIGTIVKFLHVGSDGSYVFVLCQVTRVRETANLAALPAWEGTAEVRAHPTRGKITTWPPTGP